MYETRVNDSKVNEEELDRVQSNIQSLTSELQGLDDSLHREQGSLMKNTIRKVCLLDLKTILDKQKAEVYTLIENRKSNPVDIAIDESRLY